MVVDAFSWKGNSSGGSLFYLNRTSSSSFHSISNSSLSKHLHNANHSSNSFYLHSTLHNSPAKSFALRIPSLWRGIVPPRRNSTSKCSTASGCHYVRRIVRQSIVLSMLNPLLPRLWWIRSRAWNWLRRSLVLP